MKKAALEIAVFWLPIAAFKLAELSIPPLADK
jgi:hypothetical protein